MNAVYIFPAIDGGILSVPTDRETAKKLYAKMAENPNYGGDLVARVTFCGAPVWARGGWERGSVAEHDGMRSTRGRGDFLEIVGKFEKVIAL